MQNQINAIERAFNSANIAWAKRPARPTDKGEVTELKARILAGSGEFQADIYAGLKTFKSFTPAHMQGLEQLGVNWEKVAKGLQDATNVKIARRLPQFLLFIMTQDSKLLQGSALTGLLEFCGLAIGAKTKEALFFASTGKGNENTSDVINVSRARAIRNAFGEVDTSSRGTQASVAFSKGGMLDILGIVTPWAKGQGEDKMPAIVDCGLSRALCYLIENTTDTKLDSWVQNRAKKSAK